MEKPGTAGETEGVCKLVCVGWGRCRCQERGRSEVSRVAENFVGRIEGLTSAGASASSPPGLPAPTPANLHPLSLARRPRQRAQGPRWSNSGQCSRRGELQECRQASAVTPPPRPFQTSSLVDSVTWAGGPSPGASSWGTERQARPPGISPLRGWGWQCQTQ